MLKCASHLTWANKEMSPHIVTAVLKFPLLFVWCSAFLPLCCSGSFHKRLHFSWNSFNDASFHSGFRNKPDG